MLTQYTSLQGDTFFSPIPSNPLHLFSHAESSTSTIEQELLPLQNAQGNADHGVEGNLSRPSLDVSHTHHLSSLGSQFSQPIPAQPDNCVEECSNTTPKKAHVHWASPISQSRPIPAENSIPSTVTGSKLATMSSNHLYPPEPKPALIPPPKHPRNSTAFTRDPNTPHFPSRNNSTPSTPSQEQVPCAINKLALFRKPAWQEVPVHPSREIILRSNLRHLPFTFVDPPRQCSESWNVAARTELPMKQGDSSHHEDVEQCREASNTTNRDSVRAANQGNVGVCSADTATNGNSTRKEAVAERSRLGEQKGRDNCETIKVRSSSTKNHQSLGPTLTRAVRPRSQVQENANTRTSTPCEMEDMVPISKCRSPPVIGGAKRARSDASQHPPTAPKKPKAVTLAAATQWASELGTFEYLHQTHKFDGEVSKRLMKLLDTIDQRKSHIPPEVLKDSRLLEMLQPFAHRKAFDCDFRHKARGILESWGSESR